MIYPEEGLPWETEAVSSSASKEEQASDQVQNKPVATIEVEIPPGSTLSAVSSILKEKGIITDSRLFEQKMQENNLGRRIKAGKYQIKPNSSLEEVIKIITG